MYHARSEVNYTVSIRRVWISSPVIKSDRFSLDNHTDSRSHDFIGSKRRDLYSYKIELEFQRVWFHSCRALPADRRTWRVSIFLSRPSDTREISRKPRRVWTRYHYPTVVSGNGGSYRRRGSGSSGGGSGGIRQRSLDPLILHDLQLPL